ncbi:MAG: polysaccharide deacetylase family protein [Chthonomonadales bacterium]|nr:polysaccharide deacetylase family protein [Chthonomonadales bacterium]
MPLLAAACAAALVAAGCRQAGAPVVSAAPIPAPPPQISEVDLKAYRPNEAGAIMVIMYHRFEADKPNTDVNRTPEQFRRDLEGLYKRGYRPVTVSDLVQNRMEVPPGKTPVVLTFDDSWATQFRIVTGRDGNPHIDPDCAIGILETFSRAHDDWPTRGTFFILPHEGRNSDPFGQPGFVADKFAYLLKHGYEVGNHTSTHPRSMRSLSADQVRWEIATAVRDIKQVAPGAIVQSLAVPYGKTPRDRAARAALLSGEDRGTSYENKAVVMAAWRPVGSPILKVGRRVSDQVAAYDPHHIERVLPDPRQATKAGTLEYWMRFFDSNPGERYVSDGNPKVAAFPNGVSRMVDIERLRAAGITPQPYSAGAAAAGGGRRGLSVE